MTKKQTKMLAYDYEKRQHDKEEMYWKKIDEELEKDYFGRKESEGE
jgi:hypothetical protein